MTGLMDCFLHEDEFPTKIYATIVTRCTYSNPATQTAQMICCEDIEKSRCTVRRSLASLFRFNVNLLDC